MTNPPVCLLITWESPQWRKLKKATELCRDYGLTPLLKKVYIGNVKKNEQENLFKQLHHLFSGKKDRLLVCMLCKSCLEVSSVNSSIRGKITDPTKFEIVG